MNMNIILIGFGGVYVHQDLVNVHFKYMLFTACKLFLNNGVNLKTICCYLPQR